MDIYDLNEKIAVLRSMWRDVIETNGGHCEVCDRWGKVNPIKLRGVMLKTMHWMYKHGGFDWIDIPPTAPRFVLRSYAFASLKHWGFVEQHFLPVATKKERAEGITRNKKTSGTWRLTLDGYEFMFENKKAPQTVFVYNDKAVLFSNILVTARECANEKFNYDEMMSTNFKGDYSGLDYY